MRYAWDKIISTVVYPRARSAAMLGLSIDELRAIGRLAAVEAEVSWTPEGGRSVSSWVRLNVQWDIRRAIERSARDLGGDDPDWYEPEPMTDEVAMIREALGYLEARLASEEWTMLWLCHAEGWNCKEMARTWNITHQAMRQKLCRVRKKAVTLLRFAG